MELTIDMSVPDAAMAWFAIMVVVTGAACLIAGV